MEENMEDDYIVQDDTDWEDSDVIDDIFAQTDTKLDKFLDKSASLMFGDLVCYFGIVVAAVFATYIFWQIVRWIT
jgi:hypothetical protein